MTKSSRFGPIQKRSQPHSMESETARIRKIRQSKIGYDAALHKIKTKYRTKLSRAKVKAKDKSNWDSLTETRQNEILNQLDKEFQSAKEAEIESMSKEWLELNGVNINSEEESVQESVEESAEESEEEWMGLSSEKEEDDTSMNDADSPEFVGFEDGDIDVRDDEKLEISKEELGLGLKEIMKRHMTHYHKRLEVYEKLAELEGGLNRNLSQKTVPMSSLISVVRKLN